MREVTAKFGNMRKSQGFVIYPRNSNEPNIIIVQSNTVIAKIDITTGKALFANVPGGAYFHHLTFGKNITVPMEIVQQFVAAGPKTFGPFVIGDKTSFPAQE
jgi:hypothetical protein